MRVCSVEGCNEKYCAKGFCRKHYKRFLREQERNKKPKKEEKSALLKDATNLMLVRGFVLIIIRENEMERSKQRGKRK